MDCLGPQPRRADPWFEWRHSGSAFRFQLSTDRHGPKNFRETKVLPLAAKDPDEKI